MKPRRFVIAGDNHGDMIDPEVESKFFDWLADWKPELRIHSGDLFDFRALRNGASQEEKAESMRPDYDAGMSFAKRFFAGGKEGYFLRGNHCERLWELRHKQDGALRDMAEKQCDEIGAHMRKWRVKMLPYDARHGVLRVGKMQVLHGYKSGINATRQHAMIYGNCIHGHDHAQGVAPVESLDGPSLAMGTGCLCYIDMPYNARQCNKLRHQQGWVYGLLFDDGTYQAFQAKRINGRFACANEIKSY
jgi:hypothetical protein